MVHIHIPKPLHGWREFIGEVGIIVIGVLIALGAEYLIEREHWRKQTEHAREAMKSELYDASISAWERLAVSRCLQSHLSRLAEALNNNDGDWAGMPMPLHPTPGAMPNHLLPAYAPPSRVYLSDGWKNALATGILNHISSKELTAYSDAFAEVVTLNEEQEIEASAATKLAPLSFARRLSDRDRSDMVATIAEVDRSTSLIDISSEQFLEELRDLHLGYDRKKLAADRAGILKDQRLYRGACVQAIPLNLN